MASLSPSERARVMIAHSHCDACDKPAEVHLVATRADGSSKVVIACHDHMLDPGPLLDW